MALLDFIPDEPKKIYSLSGVALALSLFLFLFGNVLLPKAQYANPAGETLLADASPTHPSPSHKQSDTTPPDNTNVTPPVDTTPPVNTDVTPPVDTTPPDNTDVTPPVDTTPPDNTDVTPPVDTTPPDNTNVTPPVDTTPPDNTNVTPPVDTTPPPTRVEPPKKRYEIVSLCKAGTVAFDGTSGWTPSKQSAGAISFTTYPWKPGGCFTPSARRIMAAADDDGGPLAAVSSRNAARAAVYSKKGDRLPPGALTVWVRGGAQIASATNPITVFKIMDRLPKGARRSSKRDFAYMKVLLTPQKGGELQVVFASKLHPGNDRTIQFNVPELLTAQWTQLTLTWRGVNDTDVDLVVNGIPEPPVARRPGILRLQRPLARNGNTIVMNSTAGLPTAGAVRIGMDIIHYTGKQADRLTGLYSSSPFSPHSPPQYVEPVGGALIATSFLKGTASRPSPVLSLAGAHPPAFETTSTGKRVPVTFEIGKKCIVPVFRSRLPKGAIPSKGQCFNLAESGDRNPWDALPPFGVILLNETHDLVLYKKVMKDGKRELEIIRRGLFNTQTGKIDRYERNNDLVPPGSTFRLVSIAVHGGKALQPESVIFIGTPTRGEWVKIGHILTIDDEPDAPALLLAPLSHYNDDRNGLRLADESWRAPIRKRTNMSLPDKTTAYPIVTVSEQGVESARIFSGTRRQDVLIVNRANGKHEANTIVAFEPDPKINTQYHAALKKLPTFDLNPRAGTLIVSQTWHRLPVPDHDTLAVFFPANSARAALTRWAVYTNIAPAARLIQKNMTRYGEIKSLTISSTSTNAWPPFGLARIENDVFYYDSAKANGQTLILSRLTSSSDLKLFPHPTDTYADQKGAAVYPLDMIYCERITPLSGKELLMTRPVEWSSLRPSPTNPCWLASASKNQWDIFAVNMKKTHKGWRGTLAVSSINPFYNCRMKTRITAGVVFRIEPYWNPTAAGALPLIAQPPQNGFRIALPPAATPAGPRRWTALTVRLNAPVPAGQAITVTAAIGDPADFDKVIKGAHPNAHSVTIKPGATRVTIPLDTPKPANSRLTDADIKTFLSASLNVWIQITLPMENHGGARKRLLPEPVTLLPDIASVTADYQYIKKEKRLVESNGKTGTPTGDKKK